MLYRRLFMTDPRHRTVNVVFRLFAILLIFFSLNLFYPARPARAETIIGSNITENTTWSGQYRVTNAISLL
jgi:hypothetical protein